MTRRPPRTPVPFLLLTSLALGAATACFALTLGACGNEPGDGKVAQATPSAPAEIAAPAPGSGQLAAPSDTPDPPSTGKEMPVAQKPQLSPEQAKAILAQVVEEMKKPEPPCEEIVEGLLAAIPIAAPAIDDTTLPSYRALQECAAETKHWRTVLRVTAAMIHVVGERGRPEQLVRALTELGEYDTAAAALKELADHFPGGRAGLLTARTHLDCKREDYAACIKSANATLALVEKDEPSGEVAQRAHRFLLAANLVVGDLEAYDRELAILAAQLAADPAAPEHRKQQLVAIDAQAGLARERQMFVEAVIEPKLALGVYHLMGHENTGAPVLLKLYNHTAAKRTLRVEVEIPGVTERTVNTLVLQPRARLVTPVVPPLKIALDLGAIRSERPVQVALKLVETTGGTERSLVDETVQVTLLPRDSLPLYRRVGKDSTTPTFGYIAAWVTPNAVGVDTLLAAAKQRHPQKLFAGEQTVTVPQVRALFEEMKARGMTYVMDPSIDTDVVQVQRTRLPAEVLATTNAQCLEGTILFATLMEAIGLRPIIAIVPGHAFVGWHTVAADGTKGEPLFLETTMVGGASFDEAVKVANARVAEELAAGNFEQGVSRLLDLAALRKGGFAPQPI